jgi:Tfp pilus assembly protein PilN
VERNVSESRSPVTSDAAAFAQARADAPAGVSAPSSRPATATAAAAAAEDRTPRRLVPAASSFDLLEGEYNKARTSRLLSVVSLGVAALLVVLVFGQFLRVQVELAAAESETARLTAEMAERSAQLNALANFDGIAGTDITAFVTGRATEASVAVSGLPNSAQLLSAVIEALPDDVVLSQYSLEAPTIDPSKPSDIPPHKLKVVLSARDYDAVERLVARLQGVEGLSGVTATWSGQVPDIRIFVQIDIPPGSSDRFMVFAKDAGIVTDADTDTAPAAAPADATSDAAAATGGADG